MVDGVPSLVKINLASWHVLVVAGVGLAVSGCRLVQGDRGVLAFGIHREDTVLFSPTPSTPIAAGTHLTYDVHVIDERSSNSIRKHHPATVADARFAPSGIASVERIDGPFIAVHAATPGTTSLQVDTDRGSDSINVEIRTVASAEAGHWSALGGLFLEGRQGTTPWINLRPIFVAQDSARFIIQAFDEKKRSLVGHGESLPVTLEPPGAANLLDQSVLDLQHMNIGFTAPGLVRIEPLNGRTVEVEVVDRNAIDSIGLELSRPSMLVGKSMLVLFTAQLAGKEETRILASNFVALVSETPDTCSVDSVAPKRQLGEGLAIVNGHARGECVIRVSFDELSVSQRLIVEPAHLAKKPG